ncbi:hypothetical protein SKAU_G00016030 [Synaphobranchus kaupii]|uniref:Uncharacterized protein n=1 Tax=Synaphobranchus kaupii TaxID=118154 RepID=A0A9Q1GAW0_SYNKA|nr:hypothetical protein SKAU_G00016030 [Synaphobranchus kaupii]
MPRISFGAFSHIVRDRSRRLAAKRLNETRYSKYATVTVPTGMRQDSGPETGLAELCRDSLEALVWPRLRSERMASAAGCRASLPADRAARERSPHAADAHGERDGIIPG